MTNLGSIPVWADRPSGLNPTTHFWFEQSGLRRRICDSEQWLEELETADASVFVPCTPCQELYLKDFPYGPQRFEVLPEPPDLTSDGHPKQYGVYSLLNGEYTPRDREHTPGKAGRAMPIVPMASFAKFYEVRPAHQVSIVRDIRMQQADQEGYSGRDFYNGLRNTLRATHWRTGDIEVFKAALGPLLDEQTKANKKEHYRKIGESYVDMWESRNASYFEVPRVDIEINGLIIRVHPEVGMRTDDGDLHPLKLWLNSGRLTRQGRQASIYLMERAQAESEAWSSRWQPHMWDVRRKNLLPQMVRARDFVLGLSGQAVAFLQIWNDLERHAQAVREEDLR